MAGPPTSAFSQLICHWAGPALPYGAVTTHGFTTPTEPLDDVILAIKEFADDLCTACTTSVGITSVDWKVGPVATGPTINVASGAAGDDAAQASPPNVAYLISLPVLGLSQRFAGRFYLPGVSEVAVGHDGTITVTKRSQLVTAVGQAYDAMEAVGALPRVFSTTSSDPRTVVSFQPSGTAATQRRRMRR